jgi:hypothetical protein
LGKLALELLAGTCLNELKVPYAAVHLDISNLDLTDSCREWVERIMETKNIRDLNEFYTRYGRR